MAYNNLHHVENCPICENIYYVVTQYKHGYMRCIDYKLGDRIELDGQDANILLDYGYSTNCPDCKARTNYTIEIKSCILTSTVILNTYTAEEDRHPNHNRHCYNYLPNQEMVQALLKAERNK